MFRFKAKQNNLYAKKLYEAKNTEIFYLVFKMLFFYCTGT